MNNENTPAETDFVAPEFLAEFCRLKGIPMPAPKVPAVLARLRANHTTANTSAAKRVFELLAAAVDVEDTGNATPAGRVYILTTPKGKRMCLFVRGRVNGKRDGLIWRLKASEAA